MVKLLHWATLLLLIWNVVLTYSVIDVVKPKPIDKLKAINSLELIPIEELEYYDD